jgi:Lower baseplate protein N-terminal domain
MPRIPILKGLPQLGAAIDARIAALTRRRSLLDYRHNPAGIPDAPLEGGLAGGGASGGSGGGGGGPSDPPAYPETFAPPDASYLLMSSSGALSQERVLNAGGGIALSDGGANNPATLSVDASVVRTSGAQSIAGAKTFSDAPEVNTFVRLDEQSSAPSGTPSAEAWLYARPAPESLSGGRVYAKDDAGREHDLGLALREVFWAARGDLSYGLGALPWAAGSFAPAGGVVSTSVVSLTARGVSGGFSFAALGTNAAASAGDLFARWEWTSAYIGAPFHAWDQCQIAVCAPPRRSGSAASIRARVRVNNTARLSALYLSLNDAQNSSNLASLSLLGGLSNNTWHEAVLANVDVSAWGDFLRVMLTAQGTLTSGNVGLTQVDVEWLMCEQWA